MVVTKEHIGNIVCEYESGYRFLIQNVTDQNLYYHQENGEYYCIPLQAINGGVETDGTRVASFRDHLAVARALQAAEIAAARRLIPGEYHSLEQQNTARILDIVKEQRETLEADLQQQRKTMRAGSALAEQFLEALEVKGPGATDMFFGASVTCFDNETFFVEGELCKSFQEARGRLSGCTLASPVKNQPFDEILNSAKKRVQSQNGDQNVSEMTYSNIFHR